MKDVALRAGVSTSTVSHVINATRFVEPETAERVRRASEELGFHPNRAARSLARGASDLLGLVISDITNPFFPELVKAFENEALRRGKEIALANTNYDASRTAACVQRLIAERARGVAVMTSEMDDALIERLRRAQVPAVYFERGRADAYTANIGVDYSTGIRQAADHLWELGHRRFGFITSPPTLRSTRHRREIFERALAERGVRARIEVGDMRGEGGAVAARRLLSAAEPPTAIMAANDLMAFGALRAARALGLRVPEDVSVIGFDDVMFSALTQPALTTVELSRQRLGEMAARALDEIAASPSRLGKLYRLRTRLVARDSTAPPPSLAVRRARAAFAAASA